MTNHPSRRRGYKKGPLGYGITIEPPPAGLTPEDDRDGFAGDMIDRIMDQISAEAVRRGWHPAEIATAVISWAVHTTYDHAGREQAIDLVEDARELIDLREARL
jgi:hypothetical protein